MRVTIEVRDLTSRQWDHLRERLQPSYDMADGVVRVCVRFAHREPYRHVEMPVRVFVALMTQLQWIENHVGESVQIGTATLPAESQG